jgi:hypothetical protein
MNIEHISVSRYQTFQKCSWQYKLKYHDKVVPPGEEPFYFVYGKIVHKIAEEYVRGGGQYLLAEVAADVVNGKIDIEKGKDGAGEKAPPIPMDYKRRMPEHLSAIKKLTDQIGYDGVLEWPFHYDLDPPNGRFIKGFIDRVVVKDGSAWIIDYKTTKKGPYRKDAQTIKKDLQLRAYARVVWKEFGIHPSRIKGALYYLEGANLIPTGFTEDSCLSAEAELLEAYRQIHALPPEKAYGNVGFHCRWCDFRPLCKFYSLTGQGVQ